MKTHRPPLSSCLGCGKKLDAASSPFTDEHPDPGDWTVCITCGHIMIYDDDMALRNPNLEEMRKIAGDKDILLIQLARKKLMEEEQ